MSLIQCCPACQSTDLSPMLDMGQQPMSLVALQSDPLQSWALERFAIRLMICRNCGHVHNVAFKPENVSYTAAGCRMYNDGSGWQPHLDYVRSVITGLKDIQLIIEVGAGDCTFLDSLETDAIKLAIDPCEAVERAEEFGIQYRREMFNVDKHLPLDGGDAVVMMRHLLEHMENPRPFIEQIVRRAEKRQGNTYLLIEVPCCQEALKNNRVEDWTYEHPQHFTVMSMMYLMRGCGIKVCQSVASYGGEVVVALAKIEQKKVTSPTVDQILFGYQRLGKNLAAAREWIINNKVALWGGAGKSAMFINMLDLPSSVLRVVDSHEAKWGFCVPGRQARLQSPHNLIADPVDYIIATTSWRAKDIRDEIVADGIPCKALLKFERGKLVEVPLVKEQN